MDPRWILGGNSTSFYKLSRRRVINIYKFLLVFKECFSHVKAIPCIPYIMIDCIDSFREIKKNTSKVCYFISRITNLV